MTRLHPSRRRHRPVPPSFLGYTVQTPEIWFLLLLHLHLIATAPKADGAISSGQKQLLPCCSTQKCQALCCRNARVILVSAFWARFPTMVGSVQSDRGENTNKRKKVSRDNGGESGGGRTPDQTDCEPVWHQIWRPWGSVNNPGLYICLQHIVSLLLPTTGPAEVTMSDPKQAEVILFLLIVREISVLVVINWARKLGDFRALSRAGGG
ncbi:uncharacterized protein V6R79_004894 [Siganus canaliculatus]